MTTPTIGAAPPRGPFAPQTRSQPMYHAARGEPIELLLVEDSPDDADLTKDALQNEKTGKLHNNVSHVEDGVEDGVEAMAFLRRQGRHTNAPRPDLILLDLNLPRKNGREVLAEVKSDPHLRSIPVVVMTSSDDEQDILAAYDHHVNCYVTKPVDLNQFIGVVRSIKSFWFTVVKLPAA